MEELSEEVLKEAIKLTEKVERLIKAKEQKIKFINEVEKEMEWLKHKREQEELELLYIKKGWKIKTIDPNKFF